MGGGTEPGGRGFSRSKAAAMAAGGGALALALGVALLAPEQPGRSADHNEPTVRTDATVDPTPDRAADIADQYLFEDDDRTIMIVTFAGPNATSLPATYDPDVLYTFYVSNAPPNTDSEIIIQARFGKDSAGNTGIQVLGIPGTGEEGVVGPVETNIQKDGVIVRAGLFDDPFFFDSQGLRESRTMGVLRFDENRDGFGARNITCIVLSIPTSRLGGQGTVIDLWTQASRFGGML